METIIAHRDPRSPAAEAYRMLRTNLQFSSPDKPLQSLVVTSSTPSEGKSTTAINLAVTFAQTDSKVLLVDADMRKPTVHKVLGLNNSRGLSNVIVGESEIHDAVQACWVDNLSVITSGPIPPNPAELLNSKRARQIFAKLEEYYDMVIIDAPPVAATSDSMILSSMASGVLLVVSYGQVAKDLAKGVVDQLNKVKANVLGVVMNRVPGKNSGYYYYDYSS